MNPDSAMRPGCYVVGMPAVTLGPDAGVPVCPALPQTLVAAIAEAGAGWRDDVYKAKRLQDLVATHHLPGVALVWNGRTDRIAIPPPLDVPFEPIELDESHVGLQALCEHGVELSGGSSPPPRASAARRWYVRLALPMGAALLVSTYCLQPVFLGGAVNVAVFGVSAVAGATLFALLAWWMSDQWLVIPGGIIIRRSIWGPIGVSLQRRTPRDSVLFIRPGRPGWLASVWRGRWHERRRLTEVECTVLLAAWQCPLPSPNVERLSDWA